MSANYFDRLEAELRAAVPRANHQRARLWRRWHGWRPNFGGLAVAAGVAVTVAVVLLSVELIGHRHSPVRETAVHHRAVIRGGEFEYPLGAVPTVQQLLDNFALLRRPQTAQDRSWRPQCDCGGASRQLNGLTRLGATLPDGYRVFVDVEQFILGGQLNMAAGSYVLNLDIVNRDGNTSSEAFGPNVGYTVRGLSWGGLRAMRARPRNSNVLLAGLVPDGVATVSWTFGCPPGPRANVRCAGVRTRTFTLPVVNNLAAGQLTGIGNCPPCGNAERVVWRSADGNVVASFNGFGNLPAPPFVKGGRGNRVLRVLMPSGVQGAELGEPSSTAIQTITRLLGPPADVNVRTGGCGIDHESVWTSPTVADPLTIFERAGRFVGYQYGAPVSEIGLERGPGAVLSTRRGLTLDDTVGGGRRLYGTEFATSEAGGGTWSATADGGTLRGAVLPIIYPLRTVTAKNPVATIQAGLTGCPGNGR
jgi:hypothetical protein